MQIIATKSGGRALEAEKVSEGRFFCVNSYQKNLQQIEGNRVEISEIKSYEENVR